MRRPLVVLGVVGLVLAGAGPAAAEQPVGVSDPITDEVGALGAGEPAVRAAIDELAAESEIELYTVFVSSFDIEGSSGSEWVDETAQRSELEGSDILLAVAVGEDTYEYGWWIDESFPLSDVDVEDVIVGAVIPELDSLSWDSAVIALAQQLRSMSAEEETQAPAWTATTTLMVIGGVAVVLLGAHLFARRRTPAGPSF